MCSPWALVYKCSSRAIGRLCYNNEQKQNPFQDALMLATGRIAHARIASADRLGQGYGRTAPESIAQFVFARHRAAYGSKRLRERSYAVGERWAKSRVPRCRLAAGRRGVVDRRLCAEPPGPPPPRRHDGGDTGHRGAVARDLSPTGLRAAATALCGAAGRPRRTAGRPTLPLLRRRPDDHRRRRRAGAQPDLSTATARGRATAA